MNSASRVVKNTLRRIGLDVWLVRNGSRAARLSSEEKWLKAASGLDLDRIRTVIDVGANVGQFACLIHKACPDAKIYSFEPLQTFSRDTGQILFADAVFVRESRGSR